MKPIPNFEDYQITKDGQVIGKFGKKLKQTLNTNYPKICLHKNGNRYNKYTHRLVLETFIGPCPKEMECNHKDGNKSNNNLSNLEWVTRLENEKHAYKTGLKKHPFGQGEAHGRAKLKENEVWLIKKILGANIVKQTYIAKMFKITPTTIGDIKAKRRWKHL